MNKLFHKLLKPKKQSIINIWTRAREAVEPELPELFEQMKEKEFAHLLYSDQCCVSSFPSLLSPKKKELTTFIVTFDSSTSVRTKEKEILT